VIWFRGEIVSDDGLKLSVLDRTFEHGLGLFETLRTWKSHPTLLSRHRERMLHSARELGLAIDRTQFPDARAVTALVEASQGTPGPDLYLDRRLRITLSGGSSSPAKSGGQLWMTAGPLPPPLPRSGAAITQSIQVAIDDPLARHKTLNYWRKRIAYEKALADGSDEILCTTPSGLVCEGTRSNLFVVVAGRLWTPSADGPLLPGIMRRLVLEQAVRLGIETVEAPLPLAQLATADEAFLTNSGRGVVPIALLMNHQLAAPGLVTSRLWGAILPWLESGGTSP
jgi:branched-subunit amino acid aminotransferase/4-amino-4-deoxychorismate lyase